MIWLQQNVMYKGFGQPVWRHLSQTKAAPVERYKHGCCIHMGYIYLYGGRRQNGLKDFWRYSIAQNEWEELNYAEGTPPEELEEPSLVAHNGIIYVYGGMMDSAYTQGKTPLWIYDIGAARWIWWHETFSCEPAKQAPKNRKGHSAVVFEAQMFVYGGYVDIMGPSQEFWSFGFDAKDWCPVLCSAGGVGPGPRYSHSAVVYCSGMYLFGGLVGLVEQNDFWKWDFIGSTWSKIKTRSGPRQLVGHSAVVYQDSMLIFGGGRNHNSSSNSLWKFRLTTQAWERLSPGTETAPPAKIYHCTVGVGASFQEARPDSAPSTPTTPSCICVENNTHPCDQCSGQQLVGLKGACCLNFSTPNVAERSSSSPARSRNRSANSDNIEMMTFRVQSSERGERLQGSTWPMSATPVVLWPRQNAYHLPKPPPSQHSAKEHGENGVIKDAQPETTHYGDPPTLQTDNLPEVLLVVGGKPNSEQRYISLWQMKLCETFLKC
ncbi:leucine-zipper-like transcriptional regulator 1 [Amblyraja radiata]|uniref:leucine-zipper-like transcriptional regulator 1 n=1 Tax=Amblyraja radiata TaxID=386614 RepID=UPI001401DFC3|nr:leucine-zipper-like transcriptional regulator 1 [Amblyraja radiata]